MSDVVIKGGISMFGKNLTYFRHMKHMTQGELGKGAGIHRTHISALEQGGTNPSLSTLLRLAEALNIEPWNLLYDRRNDVGSVE